MGGGAEGRTLDFENVQVGKARAPTSVLILFAGLLVYVTLELVKFFGAGAGLGEGGAAATIRADAKQHAEMKEALEPLEALPMIQQAMDTQANLMQTQSEILLRQEMLIEQEIGIAEDIQEDLAEHRRRSGH
jgi:hypothetical protein